MKRPLLVLFMFFMLLNAFSQNGDIGLGVILGNPIGLSAKMWTSDNTAIDASIGFDMGYINSLYLNADFLIHQWSFDVLEDAMKIYLGPGAGLGFHSEISISVRAPGGAGYYFHFIPLEAFAEIAPTLQIIGPGGVHLWIGGYIGARWYFGD